MLPRLGRWGLGLTAGMREAGLMCKSIPDAGAREGRLAQGVHQRRPQTTAEGAAVKLDSQ